MSRTKNKTVTYILPLISILILSGLFFTFLLNPFTQAKPDSTPGPKKKENVKSNPKKGKKEVQDTIKKVDIVSGKSFIELMQDKGFDYSLINKLHQTSKQDYNLAKIKNGKELKLRFDKNTDNLKKLVYQINFNEKLVLSRSNNSWSSEIIEIPYTTKTKIKKFEIQDSLYQSALDADLRERTIMELAKVYRWTIDFAMEARQGDEIKLIYKQKFLDGEYIRPGRILAAQYNKTNGETYPVYYFEENKDNAGYFNEQGDSVQKMFLKAPVAFKHISSGFTTGLRYVEAFNTATNHRAIDYAASMNTPIRSTANGTVTFTGYNGGYGNKVSIRHNSTYTTNYAHLSGYAVNYGEKVQQGEVIGYVGSTGFSTGPHLHYEMVKNGIKVNPLHEVLPPQDSISSNNMDRFKQTIQPWKKILINEF